jgi:hypothetical protein
LPAEVSARVQSTRSGYDAWFVTSAPAGLAGNVPEPHLGGALQGNVVQAIEHLTGGLRFGANIELNAEAVTRTDKDAAALADVVRFLASMAASNRDPKSPFAQMLDSLQLSAVGRSVKFSLTAPQEELERLMRPRRNLGAKKVVYVH